MKYIPYIWPLICSAIISLSLAVYSFLKQQNTKCVKSFTMSMIVVTIWSSCNAMEMVSVDFTLKLFWANMQYIAYCYSPVALLALCMQFTGCDQSIRNKKFLWLLVIPTIILSLAWTDIWHGLIRSDYKMDYSGTFPVIDKKYGSLFYVHAAYSHLLNISALVLLIRAVFFKNAVYRKQVFAMLFAASLIVFPNILYLLDLSPFKFDITPVFFGPAGLIVFWTIFRYKLFDIVPIARATVIENMDTGILILDLQDRILDTNPAFKKIVYYNDSKVPAKSVRDVCGKIPELVRACTDKTVAQSEFSVRDNGVSKDYEVLLSPINDSDGTLIGRLAVIHDITEKNQIQSENLKHQKELAVIGEREKLARDMHDNLGQVLGFISVQAQGVRQELLNNGINKGVAGLDKLVDVTCSAHQEMRDYIRNVRGLVSEESNFISALIKDIKAFEKQTDLKVELAIPDDFSGKELKNSDQTALLNIFKEALNNIRKHAGANHVKISFSVTDDELHSSVEDDGKGFDIYQTKTSPDTGFGLSIMRERMLEAGGQMNIRSIHGEGTRIDLFIPTKEAVRDNEDKINACR